VLRLFGTGSEILEAGRQRRSILRFNQYDGPVVAALRLVGGWDFVLYEFDCDAGALTKQGITDLWQGAVLRCAGKESPRATDLERRHASHPAVLLTQGQVCDFRCEFETADRHFALASAHVPHSKAVNAAWNQRRKHEQLLSELLLYAEILIPANPGLTRHLLHRAQVLFGNGNSGEAWNLLMVAARYDTESAAILSRLDSINPITMGILKSID
jgi:hypothetical protein